ncbi:emerin (Emery-Dreifuss muscular dystrophy) isoform X3 [Latimeria chalumnae]|uniref:emerin (Emery-Dreifuss muscular dystrophy) isoform X3 n=1 Tax=Latimeria chalumnae TaxID=7897 RepID=UPI00313F2587
MEDLKNLSDHELLDLLKKYDIPHGPIVETTRQLYEKKLQNYLTKGKTSPSPKSSPMQTDGAGDFTEEYEEYTCTTYYTEKPARQRVREEETSNSESLRSSFYTPVNTSRSTLHSRVSTATSLRSTPPPSAKEKDPPGKRFLPVWFQLLVFLLIVGFLFYVFWSMEPAHENPFIAAE